MDGGVCRFSLSLCALVLFRNTPNDHSLFSVPVLLGRSLSVRESKVPAWSVSFYGRVIKRMDSNYSTYPRPGSSNLSSPSPQYASPSPQYAASIPGEQPGLEVVPEPTPGLEVVPQPTPGLEVAPDTRGLHSWDPERDVKEPAVTAGGVPGVYQQDAFPEVYHGQDHNADGALPAGAAAGKAGFSKKKWLIIGGIALLVILGAILGGVLGSKAGNKSGDATSEEATTASPSASSGGESTKTASSSAGTPTPTSIQKNSPLSAVSFVMTWDGSPAGPPTGEVVVLAYKDQEGKVHAIYSQLFYQQDASEPWQAPQLVTGDKSQPGTGLGTAGYCTSNKRITPRGNELIEYSLHLNVFYINETGYVNGVKFDVAAAALGTKPSEINDRGFSVRTGSRVASYWPWVAFQDWSGFINVGNALDDVPYSNTQLLSQVGMQGTRLTVVPVSTDYEKVKNGSFGVFYQNAAGLLTPLLPAPDIEGAGEVTASWPETGKFPKITLPKQGSFTSFSYSRINDTRNKSGDLVNTYVLYQDEESDTEPGRGDIKQVWTDDSESWQMSTPKALQNADWGTDIACLTPATSNDTYAEPLYLNYQSNLTRCYFQRGGWVVEVLQRGNDWAEMGQVPLT
ncbi:hypothetical protein V8F06_007203 [Rhypophila decipiens]